MSRLDRSPPRDPTDGDGARVRVGDANDADAVAATERPGDLRSSLFRAEALDALNETHVEPVDLAGSARPWVRWAYIQTFVILVAAAVVVWWELSR